MRREAFRPCGAGGLKGGAYLSGGVSRGEGDVHRVALAVHVPAEAIHDVVGAQHIEGPVRAPAESERRVQVQGGLGGVGGDVGEQVPEGAELLAGGEGAVALGTQSLNQLVESPELSLEGVQGARASRRVDAARSTRGLEVVEERLGVAKRAKSRFADEGTARPVGAREKRLLGVVRLHVDQGAGSCGGLNTGLGAGSAGVPSTMPAEVLGPPGEPEAPDVVYVARGAPDGEEERAVRVRRLSKVLVGEVHKRIA